MLLRTGRAVLAVSAAVCAAYGGIMILACTAGNGGRNPLGGLILGLAAAAGAVMLFSGIIFAFCALLSRRFPAAGCAGGALLSGIICRISYGGTAFCAVSAVSGAVCALCAAAAVCAAVCAVKNCHCRADREKR